MYLQMDFLVAQEDYAVSPFLFILVMEALSHLLSKAMDGGLFFGGFLSGL